MAELLLELFSEEIPARMQPRAEADLKRLLEAACKENSLKFQDVTTYSTPRRLTARITGLPAKTPDIREERKGPKAGAPAQAVEGFSKSVGLSPDQLVEKDGYLYAKIEKKGRASADVLSEIIPIIIYKFPWPKSMRWGAGKFKWVRPLHSMMCILDGKVVPFEVDGIKSGNQTQGHRFLSPGAFEVSDFADYKRKLNKAYVMLDAADRKKVILAGAEKLVKSKSLSLGIPHNIIEIVGLVEWPVVLMGNFDKSFLTIPMEAVISEMRDHQKYIPVVDGEGLAPNFIFVSNIKTSDNGKAVIAGNERVLAARLSDAKFFWEQDRKVPLENHLPKLKGIVFHDKLGTVSERVSRIEKISKKIAEVIGANEKHVLRAARLSKADLVTGMVGEFPNLQGLMGCYYADDQGEDPEVYEAIKSQYMPQGPKDLCPRVPVSIALALADKLELLTSMFGIDEKPTGSKDPYALRRAALGVIRLIVENDLRIQLQKDLGVSSDVMAFLADRLKVQQREKGVRHDLIDAVFSLGHEDDLVRILDRVSALQKFLKTKGGENLLAGHKRAVNIIRIEENRDSRPYLEKVDRELLKDKEEIALDRALQAARKAIAQALMEEDFEGAMIAMAGLRGPVDAFFDNVTVNVDDKKIRENRLRLLASIRVALIPIADFSKIDG